MSFVLLPMSWMPFKEACGNQHNRHASLHFGLLLKHSGVVGRVEEERLFPIKEGSQRRDRWSQREPNLEIAKKLESAKLWISWRV